MQNYIISIGGTGAKCLEAFVHMNAAGLMEKNDEIKIIYVDPDSGNGNLHKTMVTVNSYIDAYESARLNTIKDIPFFKNKIEPLTKDAPWNPVSGGLGGSEKSLDGIFYPENMPDSLQKLFYTLYSDEERTTSLSEGFRAHPAIGAAVIGKNMSMEVSPWKEMVEDITSNGKKARIFLFGSVFGGTGAAGLPNIARIIRKHFDNEAEGGKNSDIKIAGCLMLPYFNFAAPSDKDRVINKGADKNKIIVPRSEDFLANASAALRYYFEDNFVGVNQNNAKIEHPVFDAVYVLGDKEDNSEFPTMPGGFAAGRAEQKNPGNFLEMFAALAAIDFFNKDEIKSKEYFEKSQYYRYAIGKDTYIDWDDLPKVSSDPNFDVKKKLRAFIRLAYFYRTLVYPKAKEYETAPEKYQGENQEKWISKFIHTKREVGGFFRKKTITEITPEDMGKLESFLKYCVYFLEWLKDLTYSMNNNFLRCGNLIQKRVYDYAREDDEKGYYIKNKPIEKLNEIFVDTNSTVNETKYPEAQMVDYKPKDSNSKGVEYLLAMIYDICAEDVEEGQ